MSKFILLALVATAILAVAIYFYVGILRQHLAAVDYALDKPGQVAAAQGFFAKLDARLFGWKTIIASWVAGVVQLVPLVGPEIVTGWKDLPWAQVFDERIANWITIACAIAISIFHVQGLARAATTAPADPSA